MADEPEQHEPEQRMPRGWAEHPPERMLITPKMAGYGGVAVFFAVVFMVVWLYGSKLVLDERRSGYILILVLSLLASGIPVVHMQGAGIAGGRIAHSHAAFFFVWTLIIIGATSLFSVLLAARELWALRRKT